MNIGILYIYFNPDSTRYRYNNNNNNKFIIRKPQYNWIELIRMRLYYIGRYTVCVTSMYNIIWSMCELWFMRYNGRDKWLFGWGAAVRIWRLNNNVISFNAATNKHFFGGWGRTLLKIYTIIYTSITFYIYNTRGDRQWRGIIV